MEKEKNTSRASQTRSKSERPKVWVPPSSLDAPPAPDGFRYRWIRAESVGFQDTKNITGRIREGYELVRSEEVENASDYPETLLDAEIELMTSRRESLNTELKTLIQDKERKGKVLSGLGAEIEGQNSLKALLNKDLATVARQINPYIKVDIPETTRGALYSFVYNVGAGNFRTSTLLRKINQGDIKGACDQLRRWTYAGGKQWKGLMTRREIEREICLWGQQ